MPANELYSLEGKRVWVAGHRGMVGSAIARRLERESCHFLRADRHELDLLRQEQVETWMREAQPNVVILAAAKVGGILANDTYPAQFLYENLMMEANVMQAAHEVGVEKLLFLGSSCIYPRLAEQPITEAALLTGPLEPTNQWYAIAKIAGIKLAQSYRKQFGDDFISAMPTNLYGPGDNYDLLSSHAVPALLRKAHDAKVLGGKEILIWGSGEPRREFLHVDDAADALVFLLKSYSDFEHINVGFGEDISILDLTRLICKVVGFEGEIAHDRSKPDGTPRKLMSGEKLRSMGWRPSIGLEEGLRRTYAQFLELAL